MRTAWLVVTGVLLGLGSAACDGSGRTTASCPDAGGCHQQQTTVLFVSESRPMLDIVLVLDDAALIDSRGEFLRATLRSLGAYLHNAFDTQVAILSARPGAAPLALWPPAAGACRLHEGERFLRDGILCGTQPNFDGTLDEQLACPVPDVATAAAPAGPGRPIEALIGLLGAAGTPSLAGLIRPRASLAIGMFTAGDDAEAVGPMGAVLQAGLVRLKNDQPERLNVHAFVALPADHDCNAPAAGRAPALSAFVQGFPSNGLSTSCDRDWPGRFQMLGPARLAVLSVFCLPGPLVDRDPDTAGVQPECVLEEVRPGATGAPATGFVPACTGGAGASTCWTAVPDVVCQSGLRLQIARSCVPEPGSLQRLSCATGG